MVDFNSVALSGLSNSDASWVRGSLPGSTSDVGDWFRSGKDPFESSSLFTSLASSRTLGAMICGLDTSSCRPRETLLGRLESSFLGDLPLGPFSFFDLLPPLNFIPDGPSTSSCEGKNNNTRPLLLPAGTTERSITIFFWFRGCLAVYTHAHSQFQYNMNNAPYNLQHT